MKKIGSEVQRSVLRSLLGSGVWYEDAPGSNVFKGIADELVEMGYAAAERIDAFDVVYTITDKGREELGVADQPTNRFSEGLRRMREDGATERADILEKRYSHLLPGNAKKLQQENEALRADVAAMRRENEALQDKDEVWEERWERVQNQLSLRDLKITDLESDKDKLMKERNALRAAISNTILILLNIQGDLKFETSESYQMKTHFDYLMDHLTSSLEGNTNAFEA